MYLFPGLKELRKWGRGGGGEGGGGDFASSGFRWRPVLSPFSPRAHRSKKHEKIEGCGQSRHETGPCVDLLALRLEWQLGTD